MVLRVLRLLRLARAVRLFSQFKALWMLVRGLLSSAGTISYTFLLLALILYLFANMAIELITKDEELRSQDAEFDQIVQDYFPDLFTTIMTLTQFVNLDSIGQIYRRIIPHKKVELTVFFGLFLLIVSISLMNLVTAVIVEGSLDQANSDKDVNTAYRKAETVRILPKIRQLFREMDEDGNGELDLDEVLNAPIEVQEQLSVIMETDNLVELFEILDVDGSGGLDVDEFVDGISKLVVSDQPKEQLRMQKNMNILRNDMKDVLHYVQELEDTLREEIRSAFLRVQQGLPPAAVERLVKPPPKRRYANVRRTTIY
jgi:Ca2+-binding EF-hand superfamily protein